MTNSLKSLNLIKDLNVDNFINDKFITNYYSKE